MTRDKAKGRKWRPARRGNRLGSLGNAYRVLGQVERASESCQGALAIFEGIKAPMLKGCERGWRSWIERGDEKALPRDHTTGNPAVEYRWPGSF